MRSGCQTLVLSSRRWQSSDSLVGLTFPLLPSPLSCAPADQPVRQCNRVIFHTCIAVRFNPLTLSDPQRGHDRLQKHWCVPSSSGPLFAARFRRADPKSAHPRSMIAAGRTTLTTTSASTPRERTLRRASSSSGPTGPSARTVSSTTSPDRPIGHRQGSALTYNLIVSLCQTGLRSGTPSERRERLVPGPVSARASRVRAPFLPWRLC